MSKRPTLAELEAKFVDRSTPEERAALEAKWQRWDEAEREEAFSYSAAGQYFHRHGRMPPKRPPEVEPPWPMRLVWVGLPITRGRHPNWKFWMFPHDALELGLPVLEEINVPDKPKVQHWIPFELWSTGSLRCHILRGFEVPGTGPAVEEADAPASHDEDDDEVWIDDEAPLRHEEE